MFLLDDFPISSYTIEHFTFLVKYKIINVCHVCGSK